jgi:hypothetical protein
LGTLPELYSWNCADPDSGAREFSSDVAAWRDGLLGRMRLYAEPSLRAPRLIVSGAVAAWRELRQLDDAAHREEERLRLAERVLEILPPSREEGTRAADAASLPDGEVVAGDLFELLLQDTPDRMEP